MHLFRNAFEHIFLYVHLNYIWTFLYTQKQCAGEAAADGQEVPRERQKRQRETVTAIVPESDRQHRRTGADSIRGMT